MSAISIIDGHISALSKLLDDESYFDSFPAANLAEVNRINNNINLLQSLKKEILAKEPNNSSDDRYNTDPMFRAWVDAGYP